MLSGCGWTSGQHYFIHWSPARIDVVIRERPSWDLTFARQVFYENNDHFVSMIGGFRCHGNRDWKASDRCVLKLLNRQTIGGAAGGAWKRATSDVDADEPNLRRLPVGAQSSG